MPKKHALLIGINKYLYMEDEYQLRGCVNDAKLIKNVLVNKFNFDPENIKSLHNENATRDAIVGHMDRLVETIEKDDILVFHYSGHGHQCRVKGDFTEEGSGKDNCILPTDDSEPDGENVIWREIRDKHFNEWLQRIAEKTKFTTLIFDACHSGTMTRSIGNSARCRSIPTDVRDINKRSSLSPGFEPSNRSASSASTDIRGAGGWLTLSENYTVISGCLDTQTSKEWAFTVDGESVRHGVMTYFLTRALLNAKPGNTYRDVFEQTCSGVMAEVSEQNPQIEGAIDRELFGIHDIEPFAHIRVSRVNDNTVILDGGAAHGLLVGAKWDVYPPESKTPKAENRLGILKITKVSGLSSEAQILEKQRDILEGARCIEVEPVDSPLSMSVDLSELSENTQTDIQPMIEISSVLRVDNHHGQIVARIIDENSSLAIPLSDSQKRQTTFPAWAFFEQQDQLCMPLHSTSEPNVTHTLVSNLEKIAKYKNVLKLTNDDANLDVEFNIYKRQSDDSLVTASGGISEFEPTESMVLEIKNNEPNQTLFFCILWISANKEIAHFYPPRKSCELIGPQNTVYIGRGRNQLTVVLAKDFPGDIGTETCKVFFSTKEADFSWLHQQGVRASEELEKQEWKAINRSFILKRANN